MFHPVVDTVLHRSSRTRFADKLGWLLSRPACAMPSLVLVKPSRHVSDGARYLMHAASAQAARCTGGA